MKRSDFIKIGDKINIKKSDIVYYEQAENGVLRIGTASGAEFFCVGTLDEFETLLFDEPSIREIIDELNRTVLASIMNPPPVEITTPCVRTDGENELSRRKLCREAMIEALERVEGMYQSHGASRAMALVDSILARLLAGGDL